MAESNGTNGAATNGTGGHRRRGGARKLTPEQEADLVGQWARGAKHDELGARFQVSRGTVINTIRRSAES